MVLDFTPVPTEIASHRRQNGARLDVALSYAEFSMPIIPVHSITAEGHCDCKNGATCPTPGKHPRFDNWGNGGTTNAGTITRWFTSWPGTNIGLPTGMRAGILALDVDPRNGGFDTLEKLEATHGPLPDTVRARSGSGGAHIYFKYPEGGPYGKLTPGPGVELLADGQQVLLSPSRNKNGEYTWTHPPGSVALAALPEWLRAQLIVKPPEGERKARAVSPEAVPTRKRSGLPVGIAARQFVESGIEPGKQRLAAINAVASYYGAGSGIDAIKELIWQGLDASPVGDPSRPWTRDDSDDLVDDILSRDAPPTPRNEEPLVHLNGHVAIITPIAVATGTPRTPAARKMINAGEGDLTVITNKTWSALREANDPPWLFRHAGYLSRIESDDEGLPIARELTRDRLRHAVAESVRFVVTKKDNIIDVHPPLALVLNLLATPDIDLPILSGIVTAPVFGTDGKLQLQPGYHASSRTYYAPSPGFVLPPVPDRPTSADIARANDWLLNELLGDFPFKSDADRAHAIALNLLPYVRLMIDGPTPFHMVEAPTRGTGKGKLVTAALLPGIGHSVPVVTQSAEDEMRKRITTQLAEGRRAILLDNISRLDSDVMAAVLTATVWEDRRLGSNEMIRVPIRTIWTGTANNAILSEDITRRAIRIRLDAGIEQPWTRSTDGFRHPDLMEWAAHNRAELVWAGLTLSQAWIAAGQPQFKKHSLGSFERWAAVMGGILDVAGVPGFLDNLDEFYESADVEGVIWREFVAAWWETHREKIVTAGELFPLAMGLDSFPIDGKTDRALKTAFGKALGKMRDRIVGEYRIAPAGIAHKVSRWRLLPTQRDKMLSFDGADVLSEKGDMGDIGGHFTSTPYEKNGDTPVDISIAPEAKTSPNLPNVPLFLARNGTTTPNVTTPSEKADGAIPNFSGLGNTGHADEREVFEL